MLNSEEFKFSDFTLSNYQRIISLAKDTYTFSTFPDYDITSKFILLRHDVDYSVHRALKMARIEHQEGVKATYYLLLHSEFYNLFEKEISELVKEIISLGHDIGLHFDSHFYEIENEDQLESKLTFEKNILENLFSIQIRSFCFHITSDFTINCNKQIYAGMINAYSLFFQKEIGYCSDSNGYWRFKRLEDIVIDKTYNHLQINTHPAWWQDEVLSPKKRIYRCIDMRAEKVKFMYSKTLADTNRSNIDDN
jgi:hypothetical protein